MEGDPVTAKVKLPDDMPRAMRNLPRNSAGYPIPFFVERIDGIPDFRVMSGRNLKRAIAEGLCWLCGEPLHRAARGQRLLGTFVAGPMCLVNKNSAEPPSHEACARWAARACPFLTNPNKLRREHGVEELAENVAGFSIDRNPGVTALIHCVSWQPYRSEHGGNGVLFSMGRIDAVDWMCEGREATQAEVFGSIDSGLPALIEMADMEGSAARRELAMMLVRAIAFIGDPLPRYENVWKVLDGGWAA
jgi:hypothetical protein